MLDCLGRVEIESPHHQPSAATCIATIASIGYAELLDDLLGSLAANGECAGALVVVLVLDDDEECNRVAAAHGTTVVRCWRRSPANPMLKAALYSIADVVEAERFLCLDADLLVLDSLAPVLARLDTAPAGAVLVCPEGDGRLALGEALERIYFGSVADLDRLGSSAAHAGYQLTVNDGLFCGRSSALRALDAEIRSLGAEWWVDERHDVWWRNQFVFNLALARRDCGVELDRGFNVQLHVEDVGIAEGENGLSAHCADGTTARVLHFGGVGRHKHPEIRGRFARVAR
jgi:hypothetical protein